MKSFKKGLLFFLICFGILAGGMVGVFIGLAYDLPEINRLKQFRPSYVTTLYTADGQVLDRIFIEKRFPVSIEDVPKQLIQALITTEDRSFYTHFGVNLKAIARAVIQDIRAGKFKQGGSTLTQQLAKTLFLSPEKSIVRKIREAILAIQIERRYTKKEILELYLNQIYLGSGSYGVEAAARTYFDTSISKLTLGQAALIAGLPKAPSSYSPLSHPLLAQKRRTVVLKQMLLQHKITSTEYKSALLEPLLVSIKKPAHAMAPFFVEYVKQTLKKTTGLNDLRSQGARITTTLDPVLQQAAEAAIARHVEALEKRMAQKGLDHSSLEAALVALDVKTGAIRAMVGGRNFSKSRFNRAVQARRQPGSAFKPFVYATALTKGFSQTDILEDAPLSLVLKNRTQWVVKNFSPIFKGKMTLRNALALSKNTPAVRLIQEIGPQSVIELARKAGITSDLKPYPSLALGSFELTLLELTAGYTPYANQGIYTAPYALERIEGMDGRIIFQTHPKRKTVLSRQDAAIITDMLKAVIFEGTGRKASRIKRDIGGKTGTTDDFKDALFVGFNPAISIGVWVGNDTHTPLGHDETGARAALPIWIDVMEGFLANQPIQYFDIPDQTQMVYINPDNGKILDPDNQKNRRVKALLKTEN